MGMAEEFYRSLLSKTKNAQAAKSIENVWRACDAVAALGPITVARVGRECEHRFKGPKIQSIRNARGTLKRLVELRRAEQGRPATKHENGGQELEDQIADPSTRAIVRTLMEENRQLKETEKRLKAAFKRLSPVDVEAVLGTAESGVVSDPTPTRASKELRSGIRRFLDAKHLFSHNYAIDSFGRIATPRGVVLAEAALVQWLRELAELN